MGTKVNGKLAELVYVAPSPIHGRGVFARQRIRKGHHIGTYEGPRAKRDGKYVLWVHEEGVEAEGRRGMNRLRYLNHADSPNAEFDGFDLYALKSIAPGDEITFDYNPRNGS